MIDTHAHLSFKNFENDMEEVIRKSFESGVEKIIIPGSTIQESRQSVQIAEKNDNIFAAVGIHPEDVGGAKDFKEIEALANHERVVAIGETGLDYFYLKDDSQDMKKKQRELFIRHMELAEKLDLPLIFHNRDSDNDFYEIVKDRKVRGVVHCFTSTTEFARKILDLGFLISFTGIITFPKAGGLIDIIKDTPLDRMMVETDCPFLAPVPYRGKRCEPWMVKEVIRKIAEIKGLSFEEVDEKTSGVAKGFFGI
jgi:TatD DNase family protein